MDKKLLIPEIKRRFINSDVFSYRELYDFYKLSEPTLKENTLKWRVWKLKQEEVISNVKKGVYSINTKSSFKPLVSNRINAIYKKLHEEFSYTDYCIWDTKWLNNFMVHQPGAHSIIVEVEKVAVDSVFSCVKAQEKNTQLYRAIKNYTDLYIKSEDLVIIKPLISRAPLNKYNGIKIPSLEKILVDLFVDKELFSLYQGPELENIISSVAQNYSLNYTTLISYAGRRNSKEAIKRYITNMHSNTNGISEENK